MDVQQFLSYRVLLLVHLYLVSAFCKATDVSSTGQKQLFYRIDNPAEEVNCSGGPFRDLMRNHCTIHHGCCEEPYDPECFLEEAPRLPSAAGGDGDVLEAGDWQRMRELLQDIASKDRLDDDYSSLMGTDVLLPRSAPTRHRLCPVKYFIQLYPNQVPAAIVHATCVKDLAYDGDKNLTCRKVQQYRQVYGQLTDCRGPRGGSVYRKHFVTVSVNCASKEN